MKNNIAFIAEVEKFQKKIKEDKRFSEVTEEEWKIVDEGFDYLNSQFPYDEDDIEQIDSLNNQSEEVEPKDEDLPPYEPRIYGQ